MVSLPVVGWHFYGRWRSARDREAKVAQFELLVSLLQVEMRSWELGPSAPVLIDKGRRWGKSNANVDPPLAEMTAKAALLAILQERVSNALGLREYNAFLEHLAAKEGKHADAFERWRRDVDSRYEVISKKADELGALHVKSAKDEA
jgi:hypothetical protein